MKDASFGGQFSAAYTTSTSGGEYPIGTGIIVQYCTDNGLFVGAPATKQNIIRLLPPFVVTPREIDATLDILDRAIFSATADAGPKAKVMAMR